MIIIGKAALVYVNIQLFTGTLPLQCVKSVRLEPGTMEWNQTCCKDYTWSMLNCNREFFGKDRDTE